MNIEEYQHTNLPIQVDDHISGLAAVRRLVFAGILIFAVSRLPLSQSVLDGMNSIQSKIEKSPEAQSPENCPAYTHCRDMLDVTAVVSDTSTHSSAESLTHFERWSIALGAMLTQMNHLPHDQLSYLEPGVDSNYRNVLLQRALKDSWGVENRDQLLQTVDWLVNKGHSLEQYRDFHELIIFNPGKTDAQIIQSLAANPEDKQNLVFSLSYVRKNEAKTGDNLIYAWDYGRAVFLIRSGYTLGLINESESITLLQAIGKRVSTRFHSWSEFGDNYLVGRIWWAKQDAQTTVETQTLYHQLMAPSGPWSTIPWSWSSDTDN